MPIRYSWKIDTIKKRDEAHYKDAVVQVYWTKTGVNDQGKIGKFTGATSFTTLDLKENQQFVEFSKISEDIIVKWIEESLSTEAKSKIDSIIQQQCGF